MRPVCTPTIFFPLALEEIEQRIAKRMLDAHFDSEDEFATPLPIPSVELRDPAFYPGESQFLWRGPSWACINWFLYHALKRRGFHEYYDPFTGKGHGAREFTWSGLLVDMA